MITTVKKKKKILQKPLQRKLVRRTNQKRKLRVFSRHPSHKVFREGIYLPVLTCMRFGSTTKGTLHYKVEINGVEAIKNSSDKLKMKRCFTDSEVKTAVWFTTTDCEHFYIYSPSSTSEGMLNKGNLEYPIIAKHRFGSRGRGLTLINSVEELNEWKRGKTLDNYIFEKYYNYNREYRLHITEDGCFYTCRKMLKSDIPQEKRHIRNDETCVWILDTNPSFDKPVNWENIERECIKALKSVGLDVGAVDLRVQSATDSKGVKRNQPDFIIVEINSAPSMGNITEIKYREIIPQIVNKKINKNA